MPDFKDNDAPKRDPAWKAQKREEFIKFAEHVGPMPTSMMATASLNAPGSTEWEIENLATTAVNTVLEMLTADHENGTVHEEHQEDMEAVVRQALRKATKLRASTAAAEWTGLKAVEMAKKILEKVDKKSFEAAEDIVREALMSFGDEAWQAAKSPPAPSTAALSFAVEIKTCLRVIETLLMDIHIKAPPAWVKQHTDEAAAIFWSLKEKYEPRRTEEV